MRVAMYYNNKDIRLEEMPVPEIGRDELLVKVIASGICGSDVIEWYRLPKAPRVLGHEISGEIVETGSAVKEYEEGQRVFVSHHVPLLRGSWDHIRTRFLKSYRLCFLRHWAALRASL